MINESNIKQIIGMVFIAILLVFCYILIRPIFFAIICGFILSYIFNPIDKLLLKFVKNKTISAFITCFAVFIIFLIAAIYTLPLLAKQIFESYQIIQSFDMTNFVTTYLPFIPEEVRPTFLSAYSTFLSSASKEALTKVTGALIDLPNTILKILVVFIVFFYGLRDGGKLLEMLKDSLPFKRELTERFIKKSKDVTYSVVFGRIVVGIATGLLFSLGLYIVGIKNIILLTVLAMLASIIPIIGPWAIWIPIVIVMLVNGKIIPGIFLLVYCTIVVSLFENISTPLIVSKKSKIPTSITLIGLIGGLIVFGVFGIILGPLIVAYVVVLFEVYLEYNSRKNAQGN
ncbi:MAG: AI-2E family transporter [Candidatus Pacearchaeota archaeon]